MRIFFDGILIYRLVFPLLPLNFYYSPLLLQPFENSSCARLVITVKTSIGMFFFVIPRPLHVHSRPQKCFPNAQHNLEIITRMREKKKLRLLSSFLYVGNSGEIMSVYPAIKGNDLLTDVHTDLYPINVPLNTRTCPTRLFHHPRVKPYHLSIDITKPRPDRNLFISLQGYISRKLLHEYPCICVSVFDCQEGISRPAMGSSIL